MVNPPTTYADNNERGDDPWDHDAVCWVLEQLGHSTWTHGVFFECARKQPNRKEKDLDRVIEAARICGSLGVKQLQIRDPNLGKMVVRLRRTDSDAPEYPDHYDRSSPDSSTMTVSEEDSIAARRLLNLLGSYEAELVAAGKTRSTINTYVDRTERFLNPDHSPDDRGSAPRACRSCKGPRVIHSAMLKPVLWP